MDNRAKYKRHMRKHAKLSRWFSESLYIDYEAAYSYISEDLKLNSTLNSYNALLKFNSSYLNITKIRDNEYHFIQDATVGRLHTNLTIMKSELRNFLSYEGRNLVAVDISNSQPFLSTLILNKDFYQTTTISSILNHNTIKGSRYIDNKCRESIYSYIMLVNSGHNLDSKGFQKFIDVVVNGTLYDMMSEKFTQETGKQINSRRELKSMMFLVLFTDNRFIGQRDANTKRLFQKLFPEVYEVFRLIKHTDKSQLPCILQAIEAHIMIDVIAKRISKERPQMPMYTIHDSIVCPVGEENYVAHVISDEMFKLVGHVPALKFEYWNKENAYKQLEAKQNKGLHAHHKAA